MRRVAVPVCVGMGVYWQQQQKRLVCEPTLEKKVLLTRETSKALPLVAAPSEKKRLVVECPQVLFAAVERRDVEALKRVSKGLLECENGDGLTALSAAARLRDGSAVVRVLVERGANVNARDKLGRTPLHFACLGGNAESTMQLIKAGAALDAQDLRRGATPLHFACAFARVDCLKLLIAANSSTKDFVNRRDHQGRSPLHWSALSAHREWAKQKSLDVAECLLRSGADCRARDKSGATAAHTAARMGATHFLAFIVDLHDADPEVQRADGRRAHILDTHNINSNIQRGLLHQIDNKGHSPLDIAVARYDHTRLRANFLNWQSPPAFTGLSSAQLAIALPRDLLPWHWKLKTTSANNNQKSED